MRKANLEQISNAINNFKVKGQIRGAIPYGNGHINDTFMILSQEENGKEHKYILQTVNSNVFKKPEDGMENIQKVTEYLKDKVETKREVLRLVYTHNDNKYTYL